MKTRSGSPAIVLAAAVGAVACGDAGPTPATTLRDSAGVTIAEARPGLAPTCSLAAEPRRVIGAASGDPMQELHRVFGAVLLSTGELAVENQGSQEIRIYDRTAAFVRAFGRDGGGPGEFRNMFGLWVLPGDTLWVGDYPPWRYQIYTADGEWVRTVQPEPVWPSSPREWGMLSGGRPVLGGITRPTPDRTFPEATLHVVLYDSDAAVPDTLGTFPWGRWGRVRDDPGAINLYPFFDATTELAAAGDRLAIGHGSESEVAVYEMPQDPGGVAETSLPEPTLILRWQTGDRTVAESDVEAEKEHLREQAAGSSPIGRELVRDLISDDRPAADVFPAFVGLIFGTDSSLWISEYPRPGTSDHRSRLVFDADGRLRCRVVMPADLQLYEVGGNYVLAEHRDELGVERVVLYDLIREPDQRQPQ